MTIVASITNRKLQTYNVIAIGSRYLVYIQPDCKVDLRNLSKQIIWTLLSVLSCF